MREACEIAIEGRGVQGGGMREASGRTEKESQKSLKNSKNSENLSPKKL